MSNNTRTHSHSPNYVKYVLMAAEHGVRETFISRVRFDGPNGCWEWQGKLNDDGYGLHCMSMGNALAHRLALHLAKRPVPAGLTVDHICRNRRCVNPGHLEAVPIEVNTLRGNGYYAQNARKTHCVNGHEFSAENTRMRTVRRKSRPEFLTRVCRECIRNRAARKKAAD